MSSWVSNIYSNYCYLLLFSNLTPQKIAHIILYLTGFQMYKYLHFSIISSFKTKCALYYVLYI